MRAFKADKKQQDRLEAFFAREGIFYPDHEIQDVIAILMIIVSLIINIMPCLAYDNGDMTVSLFGFMMFALGVYFYAAKYAFLTEPLTRRAINITELTKYLPINRMQLTVFRIRKICKPCYVATVIVIVIRLLISFGVYGSATILDVLSPLGLMIAWPILIELMRGISVSLQR